MAVHVREIHMKKEKFCDTKEGKESQTEVVPQMLELGETRDAVVQGSASSVLVCDTSYIMYRSDQSVLVMFEILPFPRLC